MQQMALSSGDRYGSNTTDTNPIFRMVVTFERFKGENTFPGCNI